MTSGGIEPGPLVAERAGELEQVRKLVSLVAAGVGGTLLVVGEQGIGKSTLLRAGLADAGEAGCRVAWGAADELDQPFPLRFMTLCLAGLLETGDDEMLVGALSGDPVRAGAERLLAAVDRLCAVSPLVLVAEDLQWADEASLAVWRRLSQAVEQLPLLLAGSIRPVPGRDEAAELRRGVLASQGVVLELGPLSAGGVAELAADLLEARPGRRLAGLMRQAGGNPLYVRELVDAVVRDGRVASNGGIAELLAEPRGLPRTLDAAIGERLEGLAGEVAQVLGCAAVLGREFSLDGLAAVTGKPAGQLGGLMGQAVAAGVVAHAGDRAMAFRHGLIRQAVYERIPVAVRVALHRQAARALAGAGERPELVATQLVAAGLGATGLEAALGIADEPGTADEPDTADEWVWEWLARAAPVLVHQAPGVAALLLRQALTRLSSLDRRRDSLETSLVTAATLLLDRDEVDRVARPLLARTSDPDRAAEVSWLLSSTLMQTGRLAESVDVAEKALARVGISDAWAARLLVRKAAGDLIPGQFRRGERALREALASAERAGDGFATGYALHFLSLVAAATQRDHATVLARIDRALELLGDDPQGTDLRLLIMANRAGYLQMADRLDEAGATIREAMTLAERTGTHSLATICAAAAECYFNVGQWDDALTALETIDGIPVAGYMPVMLHGQIALIAAHRDDWVTAGQHLAAVRDEDATSPALRSVSYCLLRARALAAERAGDTAAALAALTPSLDPRIAPDMSERYLLLPLLTRVAMAAGDIDTARAAAAAAAREAGERSLPLMEAAADVCRGLATADPGPLLAAAAYYESAGRPLDRAQSLEGAAVLLAGKGELAQARGALTGAAAGYRALGARSDLIRADTRLRGLGVRRGRPGRRRAPDRGWEALTPTERVIALLVADGKSNPEIAAELILSRSTVQTHVSHILAKLGTRSRVDIARHVVRRR
jgi:DNA-binding CsgD family transcriptional regulator/tetratricopeptide (TPR) repeat protein